MSLFLPYRRTLRRVVVRNRILRSLFILLVGWNLIEVHLILNRISAADLLSHPEPPRKERIFIASTHWNNELVLRSHWNQAVSDLARKLGPDHVYISIYESGSWDNTKAALMDLDAELDQLQIPRTIATSHVTHADEINAPPTDHGWIVTPRGRPELRRIPFLSRQRNLSLKPLEDLAQQGVTFDKILFLNDVVFKPNDVFALLDTNHGDYAAACSVDFSKPPNYYDTFALRDARGHEAVSSTWPFFRDAATRRGMKHFTPIPVKIAMDAAPFLAATPLRFRGIPDSLALSHLEGSECCLVHADNPLTAQHGVYLNPLVRVGYNGPAYDAVNPTKNWLSAGSILKGLWINRIRRWMTTPFFQDMKVRRLVNRWAAQSEDHREPGVFCIINEMQVLIDRGWAHV
ncbi:hypothetical protein N7492_000228 [Penicillium capsulatum]|uniref:Polysaccharide export protein n=1 Tax=Penicillium capsulatum TaxID=69766 RepID=A0A9W9IRD1_9EURO|nr:hypothetical protein N7492_000228 [Penicillium capsulatum]KAJ6130706.1 hypothetical protein N7512_003486 [Penicillium capsulatum]